MTNVNPVEGAESENFPGEAQHIAHLEGTANVPNLDAIHIHTQIPCRHNELPIYDRPWRNLFRKRHLWVCVRCDRTRPRATDSKLNDGDRA